MTEASRLGRNSEPIGRVIRAALLDRVGLWDIEIRNGLIVALTEAGPQPPKRLARQVQDGGVAIDAGGATVIPGLHDRHLHLFALAAARESIDCGPVACPTEAAFVDALRAARTGTDGTVRGVGYSESTAGLLHRDQLDAIRSDVAVRIQHRSGVGWFHNTASLASLGMSEHTDGRLYRQTAEASVVGGRDTIASLKAVSAGLATKGVTSVTDATPYETAAELCSLLDQHRTGIVMQRLSVMGAPAVNNVDGHSRPAAKIVLDEARAPSFDFLCAQIMAARLQNLPVAIHLTDRATTWLALAAWSELGAMQGDRIEHGAVLDDAAVTRCVDLGLMVVTNPALASDRATDHHRETDPDDRPHLWRCGSLIDAGVTVKAGTDAPYASEDPWDSIRAAADRSSHTWAERVDRPLSPAEAIGLFTDASSVNVGLRADLVVTSTQPSTLLAVLRPGLCKTIIGGHMVTS